jgi:hypothetical protein
MVSDVLEGRFSNVDSRREGCGVSLEDDGLGRIR